MRDPGSGRERGDDAGRLRERTDELLDEAGRESFPASDPPAVIVDRPAAAPTDDPDAPRRRE